MRPLSPAPHLFLEPFEDRFLLFNPDATGLPLLVGGPVVELLRSFEGGACPDEAHLAAVSPRCGLPVSELRELAGFLRRYRFLRPAGAPFSRHMERPAAWKAPKKLSVWLHLTNACNLGCPYCFVDKTAEEMTPEALRTVARKLLHTVRKHEIPRLTVKLTGGEPTLVLERIAWFLDLLDDGAADEVKLRFVVLTNGTRFSRGLVDFLAARDIGVGISLGGTGEVHDRTRPYRRGGGSFADIEAGVDRLLQAGVRPYIMSTLSDEALESLVELTRWILARKLRTRFSFVRSCPDDDYVRYDEKIARHVRAALQTAAAHPDGAEFLRRMGIDELAFRAPLRHQPCGIAKSHVVLNQRAESCLCPMELARPLPPEQGDADPDDLLVPLRASYPRYAGAELDPECRACPWLSVCGSGCPTVNEARSGRPNARTPFCDAYRSIIPDWIRAYGATLLTPPTPLEGLA